MATIVLCAAIAGIVTGVEETAVYKFVDTTLNVNVVVRAEMPEAW